MTDISNQQDSPEQTAPDETRNTREQVASTGTQDDEQAAGAQDASTEPQAETQAHREGAPTPPAGMMAPSAAGAAQEDASDAPAATSSASEAPAQGGEPVKEKKPWPKTQRGLIALVVVLALVLGFVGGVAGSAVVQFTGIFQQQPEMDSSDQGGDMGGMSDQMPEGGQGQMGEAPESDAGDTDSSDSSSDEDDGSSDSDTATGSFTA